MQATVFVSGLGTFGSRTKIDVKLAAFTHFFIKDIAHLLLDVNCRQRRN